MCVSPDIDRHPGLGVPCLVSRAPKGSKPYNRVLNKQIGLLLCLYLNLTLSVTTSHTVEVAAKDTLQKGTCHSIHFNESSSSYVLR